MLHATKDKVSDGKQTEYCQFEYFYIHKVELKAID